jgi:hypothetical protein
MILKTTAAEFCELDRRIQFQGRPTKAPSLRSKRPQV